MWKFFPLFKHKLPAKLNYGKNFSNQPAPLMMLYAELKACGENIFICFYKIGQWWKLKQT
jgi:hypothetical protein